MISLIQKILIPACLLISVSACKEMDDDTQYYPVTKSVFFLCPDTLGSGKSIVKLEGTTILSNWNTGLGISNAKLSDMHGVENNLWICSASDNEILEIDLRDESIVKTFSGIALAPHFICPGSIYCLISDTLQNKLGFIKIKTGELIITTPGGKPGIATYNNGKFYVDINGTATIYNEKALTPYSFIPTGNKIIDLQADKFKSVQVHSTDDSLFYSLNIDSNGDIQTGGNNSVSWSRARYSPWIYPQFGTEYLSNIHLSFPLLDIPAFTDSVETFEVDFFESRLYHTWKDSLSITDLNTLSQESKIYFPWKMHSAFFYVDSQGK